MSVHKEDESKNFENLAYQILQKNSDISIENEDEASRDNADLPLPNPDLPPVNPPKPSDVKDPPSPLEFPPAKEPDVKHPPIKEPEVMAHAESAPTFLEIYTDGSCSGNPGPGGWAAIMLYGTHKKQFSGGELLTTNNKMELKAAIEGLKGITKENIPVKVYTDSLYVKNGITEWIHKWKLTNFNKIANRELWEELSDISSKFKIEWNWVQAHNGNEYNEAADKLAKSESGKVKHARDIIA